MSEVLSVLEELEGDFGKWVQIFTRKYPEGIDRIGFIRRPAKPLTEDSKISKDEAKYVDHPVGGKHCNNCSMFSTPNKCTLVMGDISPDGYCVHFEKK